ncbi:MAG: hypothetical protein B6U89_06615 [Desulfurococcales archaeon ex4484_58]|nr:MAG: hypothetical protein B6U89_06615 [Desulfurococcales archaeon ex4484_58]
MVEIFEKKIGYIFSESGLYEPHMITFTVEVGEKIEIGDIICIRHPSKNNIPVFYQVVEVPVRRKARDYEEDLARLGQPLIDESRNYPRARAKQIGYVEDLDKLLRGETSIDDLVMLIEHIKPLSEVYRPSDEVIESLLKPNEPSIEVGLIYPNWKHTYYLSLPRLMRQGLLVVGGVGTGKTTTMITLIYRVVDKILNELEGKPHVLIIDKDGEYGSRELIELVGRDNYIHIYIDDISETEYLDRKLYVSQLISKLGFPDLRSKPAKAVQRAVMEYGGDRLELTPEFFEKEILPIIKSKHRDSYSDIVWRLNIWKKEHSGGSGGLKLALSDVLKYIKEYVIVHIDLSTTRDFNHAYRVLDSILYLVYNEALNDPGFGCIVAIDEAHLYAPERGGISLASDEEISKKLRNTIHLIATTGPRNGVTLFIATQRPSLISKTITTQMGQNIIAHRVEDVDLERVEEIMGEIAHRVTVLPRGWAMIKALASKIREPLIVKIKAKTYPTSTGKTAYDRFISKT